jgi:hypothetical protein
MRYQLIYARIELSLRRGGTKKSRAALLLFPQRRSRHRAQQGQHGLGRSLSSVVCICVPEACVRCASRVPRRSCLPGLPVEIDSSTAQRRPESTHARGRQGRGNTHLTTVICFCRVHQTASRVLGPPFPRSSPSLFLPAVPALLPVAELRPIPLRCHCTFSARGR